MPAPTDTPPGTGTSGTYYFFDRELESYGRGYVAGVLDVGLGVSASGTPSLVVQVAAGTFRHGPSTEPDRTSAGGTVTVGAADPDYLRIDVVSVYWNGSASVLVVTPGPGDSNSCPLPPPVPFTDGSAPDTVLATVLVYPAATAITDDMIYDRRFFLPFQFSGPSRTLTTSSTTGAFVADSELVVWADNGDVQGSGGRLLSSVGDVVSDAASVVDGQVAVFSGTTGLQIINATATGRPTLTAGVQSVAPINLAAEVTGDLPLANVAPATAAARLLLRGSAAGAGDWQEGTIGPGLALTGTVLSSTSPTTIRLASDATANSTTTGTEVTGLRKSSTGTGTFRVTYLIRYQSTSTGTGIAFGVNHTGTTPVFMFNLMFQTVASTPAAATQAEVTPSTTAGASTRSKSTTAPNLGPTSSVDTADADMLSVIDGLIHVTVDGNLELWYASEAAVAVQVMAHSSLIIQPID